MLEEGDDHGRFDGAGEWGEAPDHAATECAFAAWLELKRACARARGAHEEERITAEAAEKFGHDHLGPCLAALAPRLAEADQGGFYGRVAAFAG